METAVRILFLCQYFPPEPGAPAARTHEHAREWVRCGHEVTVVCGLPHYPEGVVPLAYRGRLLFKEEIDGIRVLRCWLFATANRGAVLRSLSFVSFLFTATLAALFRAGPCDVVAATSPQMLCGLAGWIVAALKRRPFVLEVRDLWPKQIVDLGVITNPLLVWPLYRLERFLYRRAAVIVAVAPAAAEDIIARGTPREKVATIPNGVDLAFFRPAERLNEMRERHGWGGNFVALYIGAHGLSQGLEVVIDAAERLKENRGILFACVGAGARKPALMAMVREKELQNVCFLPAVPKGLMPAYYAAADLCLVPLLKRGVFLTNIPSKMFEIMACARPMVLCAEGQALQLLEQSGGGVAVPPEDGKALAQAVAAMAGDPDAARRHGQAGRKFAEAHFSRADRAAEYLRILEGLFEVEEEDD
jgi:glycosyltransferase involved in cell wall biosynthesis